MSENWHEKYERPLEEVYNTSAESLPELHPDLGVQDDEPVITKHRYSGFYQTDLDLYQPANKVSHVLLAGFGTTGAITSTLRDTFDRNYLISVLADCVQGGNQTQHEAALDIFQGASHSTRA